jgi:hypothetical protein
VTDEEIDELAEALEDGCQEQGRNGGLVGDLDLDALLYCRCPFACLLGGADPQPQSMVIATHCDIEVTDALSFTLGFDAFPKASAPRNCHPFDVRLFDLGRQFRAKYVGDEQGD